MYTQVYFTFTVVNDVMQLIFNVYIVRIPTFFILYSICIRVAIMLERWTKSVQKMKNEWCLIIFVSVFCIFTASRGRQGTMGEQLSPTEKFNLITRNLQVRAPIAPILWFGKTMTMLWQFYVLYVNVVHIYYYTGAVLLLCTAIYAFAPDIWHFYNLCCCMWMKLMGSTVFSGGSGGG